MSDPDGASLLVKRTGARIRKMREDRGWTQAQLAQRSGVSEKHVGEIERANKAPRLDTVEKIAHAGFRMTLSTLFFALDDDLDLEVSEVADLIAGRPKSERYNVLRAMHALLKAGERSGPPAKK